MPIEITPPKTIPETRIYGIEVPTKFAQTMEKKAAAAGRDFFDQALHWMMLGAECERIHATKPLNPRRKIK